MVVQAFIDAEPESLVKDELARGLSYLVVSWQTSFVHDDHVMRVA